MYKYIFLALALSATVYGQDQAIDLRAAAGCGPAKTQFNVKTDKKHDTVEQVEPGKARVFVFEEYVSDPNYRTIGHVTTRVGVDGDWVGANHESSYIFFSVEPGDHRLCSDVQSMFVKNLSAAADLNAEAGKTYYYRVLVKDTANEQLQMRMRAVDNAEGALLMSKYARSSSQAKK